MQYATFAAPQRALAVHDEGALRARRERGRQLRSRADDWSQVYGGSSSALVTQFITDPTDSNTDDTFTGGSTKDDLPLSGWLWKTAKATPIKNDIAHAFAALYTNDGGDKIAYFGLDKIEADGNNFAGFWFFQGPVGRTGAGTGSGSPFTGSHVVGDILVLANYTNGGARCRLRHLQVGRHRR
ncbi:MAG: hypothetical protein KatS3mg065_1202 [Chloroflexota bacterium]|nr:MAG: hypothetical protein KatS3mg065_1202 [Chloroflexota bacterium]